jgi:hypothetical protein
MIRPLCALLLAMTLAARPAFADTGIWTGAVMAGPLGGAQSPVALWLDTHARYTADGHTYIVRPGIGLDLGKTVGVHTGYAAIWRGNSSASSLEHRIWQQVLVQKPVLGGVLIPQLRLRPEQRFRADAPGVAVRLRAQVRVGIQPFAERRGGFVVFDEGFFGVNDTAWGATTGVESNRAFTGVALPHEGRGRTEVGVLLVSTRSAAGWTHEPQISMNVFLAPPARGSGRDR